MKILTIIFLVTLTCFTLCSCTNVINNSTTSDNADQIETSNESSFAQTSYDANSTLPVESFIVFSDVGDKINGLFLKENRTYGAIYGEEFNDDQTCPKTRIWTIQSQSDYDKIFDREIDQLPLDYNQQMYVLYTFTSFYHRPFLINSVQNSEKGLIIEYSLEKPYTTDEPFVDAAQPFQYFVLIKTDKKDVKDIVFYES
ncbi:MAG: hypothetical protein IJU52_03005 [Clostridia bacterium]|nr:hypothetical protein [Clostridia bacterium]